MRKTHMHDDLGRKLWTAVDSHCRSEGVAIYDVTAVLSTVMQLASAGVWYRHPLNFVKGELWTSGARTLRLHIWGGGEAPQPDMAVHCHSWKLASVVLAGALRNRSYDVREAKGGKFFVHDVAYGSGTSSVLPNLVTSNARVASDVVIPAGGAYTIATDVFHETIVAGGGDTITLVAAEEVSAQPKVLVSVHSPHEMVTFKRERIDSAETVDRLRKALEAP